MNKKPAIRKTTQYTFVVGNVMIASTLTLILIGLFRGIVTEHNIVELVALLLAYGSVMFGTNLGRVATENRASIKYGRIITDGTPPDPKLKEAEPQDPMGAFDIPKGGEK